LKATEAQGVVFDLDGTLATIPVNWTDVRQRLNAICSDSNEPRPIFQIISETVATQPAKRGEIFAIIDEFELSALPRARLFDGAQTLLGRLSAGAPIALVTLQGKKAATKVLEMFDLGRFFSQKFTREDTLERADQVEMALSALKVDRARAMFIGDRLNDLNAAKKIGVAFTMIRTHGKDPVEQDIPVFHSLTDFVASLG
jgi:phosphoglycolate phosphatase-like HAD superfamily hydrolase